MLKQIARKHEFCYKLSILNLLGSRLVAGPWILDPVTEVRILSSQPYFAATQLRMAVASKMTLYQEKVTKRYAKYALRSARGAKSEAFAKRYF
jgi:hypothetical protein